MGGIELSSASGAWLAVTAIVLVLAGAVATARKMLGRFSRKGLLEGLAEGPRARLEQLLPRAEEYDRTLRAVDHALRLVFIVALAFGSGLHIRPTAGTGTEVLIFLLFVAVVALLFLVFLELGPSVVARLRTESVVRIILPIVDRLSGFLAPARALYGSLVASTFRAIGGEDRRTSAEVAAEDILTAVEEGERKGILETGEISMIESIIRFRDRAVVEVMTPRTEMVCIDIEEALEEAIRMAIECGHSRIPVFRENKDNIAGILYVKDLLRYWNQRGTGQVRLADIIRQPHFIPESKKIGDLFREFQSQRFHIAIILDEFGGTSGLITIEDIIEEVVGEIRDEFEKEERPHFQKLAPDVAEIDARLPIREVNERLEVDIPEGDGYDTVGGFLFSTMGKVPAVGDSFEHGRLRFEVIEADERKINRLRVRILRPAQPEEAKEA
jgi:putative hemolysin